MYRPTLPGTGGRPAASPPGRGALIAFAAPPTSAPGEPDGTGVPELSGAPVAVAAAGVSLTGVDGPPGDGENLISWPTLIKSGFAIPLSFANWS